MDPTALASQISQLDASYNPTDTYNKVTTSLGIPDARTRVQALQKNLIDTQNAIDAVDPSVTGRTSGALVTEAQRGRLVNMEKQPLNNTYTKQNQAYGVEGANLNNLTGQAETQAKLAESNYSTKRQSLATQLDLALKQQAAAEDKAQADRTFAEGQRQFNVTSQQSQQKIDKSGSSKANPKTQIINGLISVKGKDGYVSPQDLGTAYQDWQQAGLAIPDFWKNFQGLMNPKNKSYNYYLYGK